MMRRFTEDASRIFLACGPTDFRKQIPRLIATVTYRLKSIYKGENMRKYSFITQEELRSLLYYQGAVEKIQLNSSELELRKFYSINNAYETINMLLFPGIENEKSRLWTEKRRIDEQILDNMDELLNVYGNLYSLMCKYTQYKSEHRQDEATIFTYRDDRRHTYVCMENGENPSFLSTSKVMDREPPVDGSVNYFQKKDGLVLMDIEA